MAAEPVAVMVKRWECPFCRRRRASKQATTEHIGRCWHNPAVRSCKTCTHFISEPSGEWCVPGQPCNCNNGYMECAAGVDLDIAQVPVTGCSLWKLSEAAETQVREQLEAGRG